MTPQISSQIQVYHRLIFEPNGFMMEYAEVQTILHDFPVLPDYRLHPENPLSLSFELTFIMSLILVIPIFVYLAYRYGKKMGKREHNSTSPQTSSPVISKLTLSNRSTGEAFSEPDEVQFGPLVPFECKKGEPPAETNCNTKSAFNQENITHIENVSSPLKSRSSENSNNSEKSTTDKEKEKGEGEGLILNKKEESLSQDDNNLNRMSSFSKIEKGEDVVNWSVTVQHAYDKETRNPTIHQSLDDEKIKLHTDENQIKKKEVKVQFSFERKDDGTLQKIETQEIKTTYCEEAREPEANAFIFKQSYENYQNGSMNGAGKPFLALNRRRETRGVPNALVPLKTPQIYRDVLNSENQLCILDSSNKMMIKNSDFANNELELIPKSPEEAKIQDLQALLEQDDLPHETGKFKKIFKNAEVIGEGSFGEVYKVVHKLDGKIYAVKKVKLAFGKIEDLQQKSKVFREVFAMTDLHHPNIVRYSTCWVELETHKESDLSSKIKKEMIEAKPNSPHVVEELESREESDQSESEDSPQEYNVSNTSSMAFEWDVGNSNEGSGKSKSVKKSEKNSLKNNNNNNKQPKQQKVKKMKKVDSALMLKSISKTFIEEENEDDDDEDNSPASNFSQSESQFQVCGYKLYLYIQMEYCAGENLRNYLDNCCETDACSQKTLRMFRKLLEGVKAIHQRGILHRDLKPANIFMDGEENVKIGDFGLASLGGPEELKGVTLQMRRSSSKTSDRSLSMKIGTPMYSSPEQECGKRYNNKTDIYSLGLILSEMLADLSTHHERYQLFNLLRKNHDLPTEFKNKFNKESELILRMTAINPEERPSAEDLITEIDKLLGECQR